MSAYCLFDNLEVSDPEGLAAYAAAVKSTVRAHGGRYLAVGGQVETKEGSPVVGYPVLIEFPDLASAQRWYDSEDYQPLKALRQRSVRTNATFFETAPSALIDEAA